VFDVNDFDETLPGPFEWDVKRLAASLVVAGRDNGFSAKQARRAATAATARYRTAMREFAGMPTLDVWYARLDVDDTIKRFRSRLKKRVVKQSEAIAARSRTRDSTQAAAKLTRVVDGHREIVSDPPLIVPIEDLTAGDWAGPGYTTLRTLIGDYTRTLPPDRQHLIRQFRLTRVARKVVGVGSVGTQAWILLMETDDGQDPLLLQAKEAQRSVLAAYAGESRYDQHGERVVVGQRLMQAASDIFLGWQTIADAGQVRTHYYVRQLRDWKYSSPIEQFDPAVMTGYGELCGWTLARAHARTGDRIAIAAYLGGSSRFEKAVTGFAVTYADQTVRDHAALAGAVADGRIQAQTGV
jgi:uncharacterized protein (DUF2252 family)